MAEVIEDPKKKKDSFGDAAAAATDPGITQLNVGKPGDFPVNPDGTPMQKMAAPNAGAGALPPATQTEKPPGFATTTLAPAAGALPPSAPIDPQTLSDRQAVGSVWDGIKSMNLKAGAAIADVATLPLRGVVGAYDSAVVRPMRAAGVNAAYLSPKLVPDGASVDSMTPFYDQIRSRENALARAQAAAPTAAPKIIPGAGDATMPGNDPARFMAPAQSDAPLPAAPNQTAVLQSGIPPVQAGAIKTQGQMNMEADLRSAEAMKAERLAAEGRAPQAVVTHSGNDWQARNNLRNLEVSASSITAKPKDLMAYEAAVKHDTNLQGGGTAADIANLAAVNRNNEINSIAQVANARTAQQGQQFGASQEIAKQRLALDSKTQGAQAAQYGAEARLKGVQANAAEQLAALQNKYMTAKPEEQAAIAKQIQTLSNKADKTQLHTVNQPDTMAPDGMTKLGGGQRLVVQGADGSFHEVPVGGQQQQAAPGGVASPKSKAEYDALPKGAQYMKDGVLKTKA